MQIPPPTGQPPVVPAAQPQTVAEQVHTVQSQAVPPISPNALSPTEKGEKSNKSRRRGAREDEAEDRANRQGHEMQEYSDDHVDVSV